MGHASVLSASDLEQFLIQARHTQAVASLRLQGTPARLLGDLRLHRFRAGSTLDLSGLHRRDAMPLEGTPVTLTILSGEEVLTLESILLPPIQAEEGGTLLHLDWPRDSARLHRRRDVRVAAAEQAPLRARVEINGRQLDALLMNLTETGVGLAFNETLMVELRSSLEIIAELPGGTMLRCPGEVRHLTYLEGQDYPTRLGVVLKPGPGNDLDAMHRFIQARRTDLSQAFRTL